MASGGMYDHLGGGFARYSVDAFWMVPHFEKMLYDQALLARVYLHAWLQLGEERWRQVLDETITYVLRDLRQPEGGFSSAEDADSEGEEGRFYVWRIEDIEAVLGPELAPTAIEWYGVTKAGNFEGSNILHRPVRGDLIRPPEIEQARQKLFDAREQRVRPGLDDKVLTEWNALMLDSLARSSRRDAAPRVARRRDRERRVPAQPPAPRRRPMAPFVAARRRCSAPRLRGGLRRARAGVRLPRRGHGTELDGSPKPSRRPTRCSTSSGIRRKAACSPPASTVRSSSPARRTCSTTRRRRPTASPRSDSSGSPR